MNPPVLLRLIRLLQKINLPCGRFISCSIHWLKKMVILKQIVHLAKSWDISADRLEYIFHLRTDVFFHDNDAFDEWKRKKNDCSRC